MSPRNNQQLPDDQVNKVIGPRKGEEKIPKVFSDGIDILDGEFDYDISILNVEEYSLLQSDLKISNLQKPEIFSKQEKLVDSISNNAGSSEGSSQYSRLSVDERFRTYKFKAKISKFK